jgi:hypothetical protein
MMKFRALKRVLFNCRVEMVATETGVILEGVLVRGRRGGLVRDA